MGKNLCRLATIRGLDKRLDKILAFTAGLESQPHRVKQDGGWIILAFRYRPTH